MSPFLFVAITSIFCLGYADEKIATGSKPSLPSPCAELHCGPGRQCAIEEDGTAHCACVEICSPVKEDRRHVCSNTNTTWESDCTLYRARCWCAEGDPRCKNPEDANLRVEYYGDCRELQECKSYEMADFPWRMRDWLFNVMKELSQRNQLSEYYEVLKEEAKEDRSKGWSNAAIWKWCDLDGHPSDRKVSRQELFPIRAPLMALEHCLAPFLDSCDKNKDDFITLKEWGECLLLKENEISDKCEEHGLEK